MRRIPSYRLHRPSGQAVVTLSGKDCYLGPYGSPESRSKYDRLLAEWMSHGRRLPTTPCSSDLSVADLLLAYLDFARTYYAQNGQPTSEYTAMKEVARPLRDLYSRHSVRDFGPLALKAVRQTWLDQGLARRHINQRVNRVRRIFKWGVENELVPPQVLHGLQAVAPLKRGRTTARETLPINPVPDEHVDAVLPLVSRQVAAMIQLQRLTGMRPGEVVLLRPGDIDRSGRIWIYRPATHKTAHHGHSREVYLGPKAQAILKPFLMRESGAYCFSAKEAEQERNERRRQNRRTPLPPSQLGRKPKPYPQRSKRDRYDRDSYRRAIDYALRKLKGKIPHWHPHQLRHNCGTFIRHEFGLDAAQVLLGHRSAAVTEVYAEANRRRAISIVEKVG